MWTFLKKICICFMERMLKWTWIVDYVCVDLYKERMNRKWLTNCNNTSSKPWIRSMDEIKHLSQYAGCNNYVADWKKKNEFLDYIVIVGTCVCALTVDILIIKMLTLTKVNGF